ncbi:MAG: hypothetical protein KJZ83_00450 [Burkholderiaceae bacterium]|nr:hypothetical protein [Burkholderiaceae bacterium]
MSQSQIRDLSQEDLAQIASEVLLEVANDYPEDIETILSWVQQAVESPAAIQDLLRYKHQPVGVREFVESAAFMNKKGVLWPRVMDALEEINDGTHTEAVLTGGIGVAKTTLALYTQAYQLYLISCLRDPHAEFDLDPASEITVIFQSLNAKLAKGIDYTRFRSMIESSPYFKYHFPFQADIESEMRFPNNILVKPISGQETGAIGENVIGGVIDEINFMAVVENSKHSKDGSIYDQATQNYNSIARRRESRFMQLGRLPGMLCLVSSRNYPGQFTDKKEEEARTNPRIYVYDKRLWELRPERFVGEWFHVFIGDETRKPRILVEDEEVSREDRHLIMPIPVEYRQTFENDLLPALRDVAGVATQALHPFMLNTEAVTACFGKVQSIASRDDCDFKATKLQLYPKRIVNPNEPRFVHIDLAISKDSAGVSIGHVPNFVAVSRGDFIETMPVIQFDMILEIRPPRGGEIEFENIRKLIYTLRDTMNLPVKWVSFDSFQSKDSIQIMHRQGFMTGYQSMDTDTYAYDVTKQAFYDGRILAPTHAKAMQEMRTLEIDTKKNKIDHPPHGSKDVSDSMAGVVFGLTLRREIWSRHQIPTHRMPRSLIEAKPQSKHSLTHIERTQGEHGKEHRHATVSGLQRHEPAGLRAGSGRARTASSHRAL